jgi:hypothetical protein
MKHSHLPGSLPEPPAAQQIAKRLNDGYTRIEVARQNGEDVEAWQDFWIDLLHQYEESCDTAYEASVPLGRYAPKE